MIEQNFPRSRDSREFLTPIVQQQLQPLTSVTHTAMHTMWKV
jgi:hypothetical protein